MGGLDVPDRRAGPRVDVPQPRDRWLARVALALMALAVLLLVVFAVRDGLRLLVVAVLGLVVTVAAAYWVLAHRGVQRDLAMAVVVLAPLAVAVAFVVGHAVLEVVVVAALALLGWLSGRTALDRSSVARRMPEHEAPRPKRPFLVMNPRSGGGKVERFHLKERAEELGAEVALLDGPGQVDVRQLAEDAVARGADLLGVAGGDGTQALVAGVAAEHHLPFLVVSAGTRNHFALDLGLDRDDPSTCLAALTDDAVEIEVDLGEVGGRTFVNNASFGAYAEVVQTPAYRADKRHTTLQVLPDLLTGHRGAHLTARTDGLVVENPQAVLVSVNPYGTGDPAGVGRRSRLDSGRLGTVTVTVGSARQAVGLLRLGGHHGVEVTTSPEVTVTADTETIPVGVDGEALLLRTPVKCTIHPKALRVRVPRQRPGMLRQRAPWDWARLRHLALPRAG
jgi:diacylglycerol kinase family enzyme